LTTTPQNPTFSKVGDPYGNRTRVFAVKSDMPLETKAVGHGGGDTGAMDFNALQARGQGCSPGFHRCAALLFAFFDLMHDGSIGPATLAAVADCEARLIVEQATPVGYKPQLSPTGDKPAARAAAIRKG